MCSPLLWGKAPSLISVFLGLDPLTRMSPSTAHWVDAWHLNLHLGPLPMGPWPGCCSRSLLLLIIKRFRSVNHGQLLGQERKSKPL